jgi:hypothetical protein
MKDGSQKTNNASSYFRFQFEDLAKIHKIVRYLATEHYQLKKKADREHTKLLVKQKLFVTQLITNLLDSTRMG